MGVQPSDRPIGVVDALGRVLHVGAVGEILRQPLPAGIRKRNVHHLAAPLGIRPQQFLEGEHPPHDVLRRLHAVGARDDAAPAHLVPQCRRRRNALGRGGLFLQHAGVGAERRHERRGCSRSGRGRGVTGQEPGLPLVAVEAAGRVAGHAVEQLRPHVVGQHPEHVGRGEGRVQEVHRAQVRARLGQHPPEEREVVVLHEDGVALAGPGRHDVGHGTVVGPVALPRLPPVAVEARPVRQVEEVMMAVPQRRVGDDVVGLPVGLVVDDHGQQVEPVLVHEALGDRLAVRRPHRHRGPRRAAPREEPVQGGGQPAAGGHGDQRAVGPGAEGERAAVGDDEVAAHGGDTGVGTRSRAARSTSTAWGRSSCSGRLRWMRSPRSTWASRSEPSCWATSINRPSSTP